MSFQNIYEALVAGQSRSPLPEPASYIWDGDSPDPTGTIFKIQVRISETHQLQAELAEQVLENGAVVSDHLILRPRTLSVVYEQPNGFKGTTQAWQAWTAARTMWENRKLLRVSTAHELYMSMIIEHVSAIHEAPNLGRLSFTIMLRQVNFANFSYLPVTEDMLASSVEKTACTESHTGIHSTEAVSKDEAPDEDALLKFVNSVWPQNYGLPKGAAQIPHLPGE